MEIKSVYLGGLLWVLNELRHALGHAWHIKHIHYCFCYYFLSWNHISERWVISRVCPETCMTADAMWETLRIHILFTVPQCWQRLCWACIVWLPPLPILSSSPSYLPLASHRSWSLINTPFICKLHLSIWRTHPVKIDLQRVLVTYGRKNLGAMTKYKNTEKHLNSQGFSFLIKWKLGKWR